MISYPSDLDYCLCSLKTTAVNLKMSVDSFFPATGVHASLYAGLFEEGLSVPILFHGNLREEQAFVVCVLHEQAVAADLDLFKAGYAAERREDGDFVFEQRQLRRGDRVEARIAESGKGCGVADGEVKRLDG